MPASNRGAEVNGLPRLARSVHVEPLGREPRSNLLPDHEKHARNDSRTISTSRPVYFDLLRLAPGGESGQLLDEHDRRLLSWAQKFNPYDLYSKCSVRPDYEKLQPYDLGGDAHTLFQGQHQEIQAKLEGVSIDRAVSGELQKPRHAVHVRRKRVGSKSGRH